MHTERSEGKARCERRCAFLKDTKDLSRKDLFV